MSNVSVAALVIPVIFQAPPGRYINKFVFSVAFRLPSLSQWNVSGVKQLVTVPEPLSSPVSLLRGRVEPGSQEPKLGSDSDLCLAQ